MTTSTTNTNNINNQAAVEAFIELMDSMGRKYRIDQSSPEFNARFNECFLGTFSDEAVKAEIAKIEKRHYVKYQEGFALNDFYGLHSQGQFVFQVK